MAVDTGSIHRSLEQGAIIWLGTNIAIASTVNVIWYKIYCLMHSGTYDDSAIDIWSSQLQPLILRNPERES